jgi:hypothetical protein
LSSANAATRQVDLAAHLQQLGRIVVVEHLGDLADRPHVGSHVFAGVPVAAGRAADQTALLIRQVDRQTVDLELADELDRAARVAHRPLGPGGQLVGVEDVVEREHPLGVLDLGELRRERAAHVLRGRIGGTQPRISRLERLELAIERVELGVGDDRRIELVIAVLMVANLVGQFGVPGAGLGRRIFPGRGHLLGGGHLLEGEAVDGRVLGQPGRGLSLAPRGLLGLRLLGHRNLRLA